MMTDRYRFRMMTLKMKSSAVPRELRCFLLFYGILILPGSQNAGMK